MPLQDAHILSGRKKFLFGTHNCLLGRHMCISGRHICHSRKHMHLSRRYSCLSGWHISLFGGTHASLEVNSTSMAGKNASLQDIMAPNGGIIIASRLVQELWPKDNFG